MRQPNPKKHVDSDTIESVNNISDTRLKLQPGARGEKKHRAEKFDNHEINTAW